MKNTQKIILSFVFVLGMAFLTHYFFVQRIESKERELASFSERNTTPQIKWEQKIADELSESTATQVSVKPNWQDLLVYEYLSGHYDVTVRQGQIEKMQLQPAMNGVRFQTKDFMEKFGHQIKSFATYKIERTSSNNEHVQLFDQTGSQAGSVQIQRDDKGLVKDISFQ